MRITCIPSNRTCFANPSVSFSKKAVQEDILAGNRIESGFVSLSTPTPVTEDVVFKVYRKRGHILIAALLLRPTPFGARTYDGRLPGDETLEILFDPHHDHSGYIQFLFPSKGPAQRYWHMPYPEARTTSFRLMESCGHAWAPYADCAGQLLGLWLFARFFANDIFQQGSICGFNIARSRAGSTQLCSWNFASGAGGFPDATGFGHLHRKAPEPSIAVDRIDLTGTTLRIAGRGRLPCECSLVRVVDPLGASTDTPVAATSRDWETQLRLSPIHGCYRLYFPQAAGAPHFFMFELKGRRKPAPFRMGMTYDYPDNLIRGPYSAKRLGAEFSLLRECGVSRLYWIDYPMAMLRHWDWKAYPETLRHISQTQKQCGEILPLAARLSREQGMEFFGVYKLFDLGHGGHPEWTMQTNPAWRNGREHPVTRLRLFSTRDVGPLCKSDFRLWVSEDNRSYTPYSGSYRFQAGVVSRPHLRQSPAGNIPEQGRVLNGFVEFCGLELHSRYVAIDVLGKKPEFTHRAFAFLEASDQYGRILPVIPGQGSLDNGFQFTAPWGWANASDSVLGVFTWRGGSVGLRFGDSVLPEAGTDPLGTMRTLPEPMFAGVQALWLSGIANILDSGADGVDLRILSHHVQVSDYLAIAYAEPVREAFRKRYGRESQPIPEDYERIRRLRGEAFTQFMMKAKRRVAEKGKKLCVHFEGGQEVPPHHDMRMQINFEWEKWIIERLVDEITVKAWAARSPFVHERLLPLARKVGIPVHLCSRNSCLVNGGDVFQAERLVAEAMEAGFSGYHFYEAADYLYVNSQGVAATRFNALAALQRASQRGGAYDGRVDSLITNSAGDVIRRKGMVARGVRSRAIISSNACSPAHASRVQTEVRGMVP